MEQMDAHQIISFIQNSKKATPVKVYLKGDLEKIDFLVMLKLSLLEMRELFLENGQLLSHF